MQENIYELMMKEQEKKELVRVLACNVKSERFGLVLSEEQANELMVARKEVLTEQRRVEFKEGILPKMIDGFCDSQYITQDDYANTLAELQEIFYMYKNESEDRLTDDELITFMKDQYESVCYGSLEYLSETCLERFSMAIRAGYRGYEKTSGQSEYEQFSEEQRWDRGLFLSALEELIE